MFLIWIGIILTVLMVACFVAMIVQLERERKHTWIIKHNELVDDCCHGKSIILIQTCEHCCMERAHEVSLPYCVVTKLNPDDAYSKLSVNLK